MYKEMIAKNHNSKNIKWICNLKKKREIEDQLRPNRISSNLYKRNRYTSLSRDNNYLVCILFKKLS